MTYEVPRAIPTVITLDEQTAVYPIMDLVIPTLVQPITGLVEPEDAHPITARENVVLRTRDIDDTARGATHD